MCLQVMVPVVGLTDPTALDVDVDQKYVYFAQARSRKIQRVRILQETARVEDFVTEGVGKVRFISHTSARKRFCSPAATELPDYVVWTYCANSAAQAAQASCCSSSRPKYSI